MAKQLKLINILFLLVFLPVFLLAAEVRAGESPSAVVTELHDNLLGIMKDAKRLGVKARYQRLEPKIDHLFDMPRMTRIAASDSWKTATPEQRDRLIKAFKHMGVSRLVTLFDGYSGEMFETLDERDGPQNSRIVRTHLVIPGKKPVGITYITVRTGDSWAIIDALLDDNISELAVRRSEYRAILKKDGVEGLIEILNNKAEELLSE